ncbi:cell division protein ZipA [Aliiglaciecola sp. LCG003]|uniref:cell division protein ZipA n=1 Tax=Aliiglaciecola sp. LCG003 TaxID=3053655 RepID=UPI0025740473|nr:cell division protein ZipA [Aliiglaciecola sp. LCG003]WJG10900.1 cell division protein ZipA [Aliiglaciecola sp. LCG003]
MEDLRLAFLVIGLIAITGILVHGLWSVRKNAQDKGKATLEPSEWDEDDVEDVDTDDDYIVASNDKAANRKVEPSINHADFDDLGLGAVRVISPATPGQSSESSAVQDVSSTSQATAVPVEQPEPQIEAVKPKIYSSVVTQPKPQYAADQISAMRSRTAAVDSIEVNDIPEPPPFLLKTESQTPSFQGTQKEAPAVTATPAMSTVAKTCEPVVAEPQPVATAVEPPVSMEKVSLADQARNFVKRSKTEAQPKRRREPKIREDQMRIDFDEPDLSAQPAASDTTQRQNTASASTETAPSQEVLVLNVKAADDAPIQGAALLPMLLTLGFKFGDQDIFHRHVNSNGKGPVLFSLANMFKPGVFDIDNLENFSTQGVSLFMMLPIEGDPHQVFNMMHNAARKIADEFSAQVLDGRRSALTKQSLQQYVEKIREFERKRMIAR